MGCSTFLVRHAWLALRGVVAEALVQHDLSVAQFASLLMLDEVPGLSVADVARKVSTARQSANEMLGGLERAGLVERRPHPSDRRTQQIFLTDAGRRRLAEAMPRMVVSIQMSTAAKTRTDSTRRCRGTLIDRSLTVMWSPSQDCQVPVNRHCRTMGW